MGLFDSKNFNSEVFQAYVDKTPNLNRNELIKSRAIKQRQDLLYVAFTLLQENCHE